MSATVSEDRKTLGARQAAFMEQILDENAPLPQGWGNSQAAGMQVYRGNYRSALMDALGDTFERVKQYVGDAPFQRVAAHHVIANPPAGWTIDEAGAGFDESCAKLFGNNPEVAELAWLEWTMLGLATAPDSLPLDANGFGEATAQFGDDDWAGMKLVPQPRAASRVVAHDLTAIWTALGDGEAAQGNIALNEPRGCLVWREGERPTFLMVDAEEAQAFAAVQDGASYGEVCILLAGENTGDEAIQNAAMRAGAMLGRWLNDGLIVGLS
ncbi:MAG: DNA-binding domain-containing protein [Pseudomonadota bacterium]